MRNTTLTSQTATTLTAPPPTTNPLTPRSGQPTGWQNLCNDIITGCIQFYVEQGDKTIAQGNRHVSSASANPKDQSTAAYLQWTSCLSQDTMQDMALKILSAAGYTNGGEQKTTCTSDQVTWRGNNAQGILKGFFNSTGCKDFNSLFQAKAQSCESLVKGVEKEVALVAGVIAGLVFVLGALCLLYNKCEAFKACCDKLTPLRKCCSAVGMVGMACCDESNGNSGYKQIQ